MTQLSFLDAPYVRTSPTVQSEQADNLSRVTGRIAKVVADFMAAHEGQTFYVSDLHAYVQARAPGAPGSPDRILRDLRRRGVIRYELVSRSESLYRSLPVEATP